MVAKNDFYILRYTDISFFLFFGCFGEELFPYIHSCSIEVPLQNQTENEGRAQESLDTVRLFPRSSRPSVSNLLCGTRRRERDGVGEMFENVLPHNSSVTECLKQCGCREGGRGGGETAPSTVTNPLQVFNGWNRHTTLGPDR